MRFQLTPRDEFIGGEVSGLVSPEAWTQVLQALRDAIKPLPQDRLVLDLTALLGYLGTPERRAVGVRMAACLGQMKKVALVIQAEKITGVVEEEAQARGLDLKLFSSYEVAVSWVVS